MSDQQKERNALIERAWRVLKESHLRESCVGESGIDLGKETDNGIKTPPAGRVVEGTLTEENGSDKRREESTSPVPTGCSIDINHKNKSPVKKFTIMECLAFIQMSSAERQQIRAMIEVDHCLSDNEFLLQKFYEAIISFPISEKNQAKMWIIDLLRCTEENLRKSKSD